MDLINKPDDDDLPLPDTCEDRPISLARWRKHRDTLMRWEPAGHRPPEWWHYERKMRPPPHETETLLKMGELVGAELAEVMTHWRERYEHAALDPTFGWCIGHAKDGDTFASWIDGDAGRREHYRFWGIPRALVKKWDRERIRNARTVAKLKAAALPSTPEEKAP
jgi:hypothetical protein